MMKGGIFFKILYIEKLRIVPDILQKLFRLIR
jgi:hypothetical protein